MYIDRVTINNIRGINLFRMDFPAANQAGWHVIIGDNASGKTTILRAIALCLFGPEFAPSLQLDWNTWLPSAVGSGVIELTISNKSPENNYENGKSFPVYWRFIKEETGVRVRVFDDMNDRHRDVIDEMRNSVKGWFSAGFGPFRRFSGGAGEWNDIYRKSSYRRIAAHLSLFNESVAMTEITEWLKFLKFRSLEGDFKLIDDIFELVNSPDFLPLDVRLAEVNSNGVFFKISDGEIISIDQLSDGFRSILSLTLELVRQLSNLYSDVHFIRKHTSGYSYIEKPGVVLIDEIDAHLHPTWQNEIGQWFLKYFPHIQFIVTTHSPIICRACEHGSIWKLPAPGTNEVAREVTGTEKDRLVYGNILDQFSTEDFGKKVTRSRQGTLKLNRLAELNINSSYGKISEAEKNELNNLRKIFVTDDTTAK